MNQNRVMSPLALWDQMRSFPNMLSLSRLLVALVITGIMVFFDSLFAAAIVFVLFVLAAITDFFDGYYARKSKKISIIGGLIDSSADKILVITVLILVVADLGMHPLLVISAVLIVIREVSTMLCRLAYDETILFAPDGKKASSNRWKVAVQVGALALLLLSIVFSKSNNMQTGFVYCYNAGAGLLAISALLGFVSGWKYYTLPLYAQAKNPQLPVTPPRKAQSKAG